MIASKLELLGKPGLDLVDDGQLGGPFIGFGQEALGLVEQAGVLERDAQAGGQRAQQVDVGIAEGVGAVEVLEGDHPGDCPPVIKGTKIADCGSAVPSWMCHSKPIESAQARMSRSSLSGWRLSMTSAR